MPASPRGNAKARKLAEKILGKPVNQQGSKKKKGGA